MRSSTNTCFLTSTRGPLRQTVQKRFIMRRMASIIHQYLSVFVRTEEMKNKNMLFISSGFCCHDNNSANNECIQVVCVHHHHHHHPYSTDDDDDGKNTLLIIKHHRFGKHCWWSCKIKHTYCTYTKTVLLRTKKQSHLSYYILWGQALFQCWLLVS